MHRDLPVLKETDEPNNEDDYFDDVVPADRPWPTQVGLFDEVVDLVTGVRSTDL